MKKVTPEEVTLYRPYGVSEDFTTTSGVICYTGLEVYKIPRNRPLTYLICERPPAAK